MDRRMTALQKSANAPINRTVDKIHLVALGLLGAVVDLVVTNFLYSQDFSLGSAQFSGFLMASGAGYFLSLSRLFKDRATQKKIRSMDKFYYHHPIDPVFTRRDSGNFDPVPEFFAPISTVGQYRRLIDL
jgi:hypothetical protein